MNIVDLPTCGDPDPFGAGETCELTTGHRGETLHMALRPNGWKLYWDDGDKPRPEGGIPHNRLIDPGS